MTRTQIGWVGLVYHAHFRPLTAPLAALLDASAVLHARVSARAPTPAGFLRALKPAFDTEGTGKGEESPLDSMANLLTVPPIHVEQVAQAICVALDPAREDVHGVVGVYRMRELLGWES
jgi:hypothetical protein